MKNNMENNGGDSTIFHEATPREQYTGMVYIESGRMALSTNVPGRTFPVGRFINGDRFTIGSNHEQYSGETYPVESIYLLTESGNVYGITKRNQGGEMFNLRENRVYPILGYKPMPLGARQDPMPVDLSKYPKDFIIEPVEIKVGEPFIYETEVERGTNRPTYPGRCISPGRYILWTSKVVEVLLVSSEKKSDTEAKNIAEGHVSKITEILTQLRDKKPFKRGFNNS